MKKWIIFILMLAAMRYSPAQTDNSVVISDDIQLIHLHDSVYIHMSWHTVENFGRFSSNGLIVIKDGQALMIDTPMDNEKTEILTRFVRDTLSADITHLIIGHFHDDCMGGLPYLQSIGVESIANSLTIDICKETGLPVPSVSFTDSLHFDLNGKSLECRYFGAGHSIDNIVVWIPDEKILFGGCLIRSVNSTGPGNLSDAVVSEWDATVKKLLAHYPDAKIVIPGHGNYGGVELLTHTIKIVEKVKDKN